MHRKCRCAGDPASLPRPLRFPCPSHPLFAPLRPFALLPLLSRPTLLQLAPPSPSSRRYTHPPKPVLSAVGMGAREKGTLLGQDYGVLPLSPKISFLRSLSHSILPHKFQFFFLPFLSFFCSFRWSPKDYVPSLPVPVSYPFLSILVGSCPFLPFQISLTISLITYYCLSLSTPVSSRSLTFPFSERLRDRVGDCRA